MSSILLTIAILLIALSKRMHKDVHTLRTRHNIQEGEITYSDLNIPAKPFFSPRYRITGKPDYITKKNNRYIPVEVKTGQHHKPQIHHIFQLATYCQLLEEHYGGLVPYGMLVYNDTSQQYKIPFDPKLRFELESTIKRMRHVIKKGELVRNHQDPHRCTQCSMRSYCQMKLV